MKIRWQQVFDALSLSLSHARTHAHSLTHARTHTHSHTHARTHARTHTHNCTRQLAIEVSPESRPLQTDVQTLRQWTLPGLARRPRRSRDVVKWSAGNGERVWEPGWEARAPHETSDCRARGGRHHFTGRPLFWRWVRGRSEPWSSVCRNFVPIYASHVSLSLISLNNSC